jgi:CrcB protein
LDKVIVVGLGGFIGSAARYLLGSLCQPIAIARLPVGTLLVNGIGGLLAGGLYAFAADRELLRSPVWLFLYTGLLGGFTTFSAFSLEATSLWQSGRWTAAVAYVAASLILGLGGVVLGMAGGRMLLN